VSSTIPLVSSLSKQQIEAHALGVLRQASPASLDTPGPVPILNFFDYKLQQLFGIRTGNSDRLPFGYEGVSSPPSKERPAQLLLATSVYLALCEDQPRARFTAAHECAHGILHGYFCPTHRKGKSSRRARDQRLRSAATSPRDVTSAAAPLASLPLTA
jgi:hypothetical protein